MTEALYRVTRDPWEPYSHLEIVMLDGLLTPWVTLRGCGGPPGSEVLGEQKLIFFQAISKEQYEDFRDWTPPDDVERIAVNWPMWEPSVPLASWAEWLAARCVRAVVCGEGVR